MVGWPLYGCLDGVDRFMGSTSKCSFRSGLCFAGLGLRQRSIRSSHTQFFGPSARSKIVWAPIGCAQLVDAPRSLWACILASHACVGRVGVASTLSNFLGALWVALSVPLCLVASTVLTFLMAITLGRRRRFELRFAGLGVPPVCRCSSTPLELRIGVVFCLGQLGVASKFLGLLWAAWAVGTSTVYGCLDGVERFM